MNYYRRVWEWKSSGWVVIFQGFFEYLGGAPHPDKPPCVPSIDYKTVGCSVGVGQPGSLVTLDPPLYEIWWRWNPSTWGAGNSGSWQRASAGRNW